MAKLVVCQHEDSDGDRCGFETRSTEEEVIISTVQQHAESEHALDLSRGDVRQMIQEE